MNTNYKIDSILFLLDESCVLERYFPLISKKAEILSFLRSHGVERKNDCFAISDDVFLKSGVLSGQETALFRKFLCLYDVNPSKMKEMEKLELNADERKVFQELYLLPGVKKTRAKLYYKAGLCSLYDIALLTASEVIAKCLGVIEKEKLPLKAPLVKEANTHVAVAKAFTK